MRFKSIRKKDQHEQLSRRALIGWMGAAGACLSIPAWKVWEVIEGSHGTAYAQDASCMASNRAIFINMGVGGLAHATQWFTSPYMGQQSSGGEAYLWIGAGDRGEMAATSQPLWATPAGRRMLEPITDVATYGPTLMIGDDNETHTRQSVNGVTSSRGLGVKAAAGANALQNPGLLAGFEVAAPFIGAAPGQPQNITVPSAQAMIDNVNSAATQAGALLANEANASRWKANYDALMSLNKAAGNEATKNAFGVGKTSAFVIGKNLAALLQPSLAQQSRYAGAPGRLREFGEVMAIGANCFINGICSMIHFQGFNDDPHQHFNDIAGGIADEMVAAEIVAGLFTDLSVEDPYCPGSLMYQKTVTVFEGDTMKNPYTAAGWPDGTPNGGTGAWVFGAGELETGMFGTWQDGTLQGWDLATGAPGTNLMPQHGQHIAAIIMHAINRRDTRATEAFGAYNPGVIAIAPDGT